jgi:hypothetical protein
MNIWQLWKRVFVWISLFFVWWNCSTYVNADTKPGSSWPPEGQPVMCPVIRDTSVSSVGEERTGNNGRAGKIKVKGQQECILLDIDTTPLKGKVITGALLHIRSATPQKAQLARLGVSTLASQWVEGTATGYRSQAGSSCYNQAEHERSD